MTLVRVRLLCPTPGGGSRGNENLYFNYLSKLFDMLVFFCYRFLKEILIENNFIEEITTWFNEEVPQTLFSVADPENFGGGDLKHKTSKIWMSSPKLRVIFRPKSEIQTFFSPKFRWSPKKKKKRSSPKLRVIFRPKSEIQTFFSPIFRWSPKKKKGLHQNCDWFFAGLVTFRSVGGMHPEMEPNYSKQRLIFRPKSLLLGWWGGCIPPIPPLNPPLLVLLLSFSAKIDLIRFV